MKQAIDSYYQRALKQWAANKINEHNKRYNDWCEAHIFDHKRTPAPENFTQDDISEVWIEYNQGDCHDDLSYCHIATQLNTSGFEKQRHEFTHLQVINSIDWKFSLTDFIEELSNIQVIDN